MDPHLLQNTVIILGLGIISLAICYILKIPSMIGFLITGILAGNHVFNIIKDSSQIESLSEIGIILLLFTIGIEFSLKKIMEIKKSMFIGGSIQVAATTAIIMLASSFFGLGIAESFLIGFLISLSSTAIVLKAFQEKNEMNTPHGKTSLAILVFQDIIVVLMVLFMPVLSGNAENIVKDLSFLALKGSFIIGIVILSAKYIVPNVLYRVAKTHNKDLFLMSIIVLCFGIAILTEEMGLSLGLGAFLAGLIISESEYGHETMGRILPFKEVFLSLFFISIGMLLNIEFFIHNIFLIFGVTLSIVLIKMAIATISSLAIGIPLRTSFLVGFSISQIGEFSFVLSKAGVESNILSAQSNNVLFASIILSMALAPIIIKNSNKMTDLLLKLPWPKKIMSGLEDTSSEKISSKKNHVIIIGFGLNGRNLVRAAEASGIKYAIIEMNPETVKKEMRKELPILYGDASNEEVLKHAHINTARIVVVAINDSATTRRIVKIARRLNKNVKIIARTHFVEEVKVLKKLGADQVIPDEVEASLEIFSRVLSEYLVPKDRIERFIDEIHADNYIAFRDVSKKITGIKTGHEIDTASILVEKDSFADNKKISDLDIRRKHKITIVAIKRKNKLISNPDPSEVINPNDILIILGLASDIRGSESIFRK